MVLIAVIKEVCFDDTFNGVPKIWVLLNFDCQQQEGTLDRPCHETADMNCYQQLLLLAVALVQRLSLRIGLGMVPVRAIWCRGCLPRVAGVRRQVNC